MFKKLMAASSIAVLLALAIVTIAEGHSGNVRRSDCTHVVSATGERHRHTGRPYCPTLYEEYMTTSWMHH